MELSRARERYLDSTPTARRPGFVQAHFGPEFVADPAHAGLLAGVGVVIGFHPDQATEPIVDYAVAAGKPFVVVPCCVFSREFPGRRLPDGSEVTSYEHFVEYLRAKAPPGVIRSAFLPYNGRNCVLHTLPPQDCH